MPFVAKTFELKLCTIQTISIICHLSERQNAKQKRSQKILPSPCCSQRKDNGIQATDCAKVGQHRWKNYKAEKKGGSFSCKIFNAPGSIEMTQIVLSKLEILIWGDRAGQNAIKNCLKERMVILTCSINEITTCFINDISEEQKSSYWLLVLKRWTTFSVFLRVNFWAKLL